jgi:PKD repeat protein
MSGKIKSISLLLCLIALIIGCNSDNGVTPQPDLRVLSVTPNEVSRGANLIPIEVNGSGFVQNVSIDLGSDIQVVSQSVRDPQHIEAVIDVSPAAQPGPRTLILSASNGNAQLANAINIRKNPAPVVTFSVFPNPSSVSVPFQLDASGSTDNGTIVSYDWKFSDGGSRHGVNAKYTFDKAGDYSVTLTLTDNQGGISSAAQDLKVVENLPPIASFDVTPSAGSQLTVFTFDATSSRDLDGTIKHYHWDFADGAQSNNPVVKHQFPAPGKYRVELTVKDNNNQESVESVTFRVKEFDLAQAARDINDVTKDFLRRFGDLETLSAEEIVVGFSTGPGCPGRQHEINIINNDQAVIVSSGVQIMGDAIITNLSETKANADLTARFFGTKTDGSSFDGVHTHHFEMVNEGGIWRICDFTLD